MIKRYIGISLLTASMLVAGCSSDDDDPAVVTPPAADPYVAPDGTTLDLLQTATNDPRFTSLLQALTDAGLGDTFSDANTTGANTIFAPTNDAFTAYDTANPGAELSTLTEAELVNLLTFHVNDDPAGVNAAAVTAAVGTAGLTMSNGEVAVVTSSAAGLQIAGAQISGTDVFATNGIIHVLDALMTLPEVVTEPPTPPVDGDNIIAALTALGGYSTFLGVIEETGFTDTFTGDNEGAGWTMFAPTDAAVAAADPAALDGPAKALWVRLHVLSGTVASTSLTSGPQTMNSGAVAEVVVAGSDISIGGANVTSADNTSANGVLHLIDAVIVPN